VLNRNEYTRISLSIHPDKNTFDVYVNGLLVKSGVEYMASTLGFTPQKYQIEEVRLTQISMMNGGGMYVDNVAVYKASKPVCTVTSGAKNGVYLEGGVLRYYENSMIAIGFREISGEFCGVKYEKERVNFGTVNGNGGAEDVSYMMYRVQEHGGEATYMGIYTTLDGFPHTSSFNYSEKVLVNGVKMFCSVTYDILGKEA
jgi:hypothetical protein